MALMYEKQEFVLNFKDEKPKKYRIAPVRQQQVTFEKLLEEVSNSCGVNRAQVKATVEALIDRMLLFMDYGMSVKLGEFGSFKPTFNSRSADTAEELDSGNVVRKKILFYPGKRFRKMLDDISITAFSNDETPSPDTGTTPGTGGSGGGDTGGGDGGTDFE